MKQELVSFVYFKDYASFLLKNHLDDLVHEDLKRSREVNLPLLKYFEHLKEEDLFSLSQKGIVQYLEQIVNGTALSVINQSMLDWKADKLQGISRETVVASDIALIYNVRKHSLLNFLPKYTSDIHKVVSIMKEVEDFYTYQESMAIQTFSEIKKEEIAKSENRLKEAQELAKLGYWDYDIDTNHVTWSEELFRIYGLKDGEGLAVELIAKHLFEEDIIPFRKKISEIKETGGTFTHEYKIRRSDGATRILVDKAYTERKPDGKLIIKGVSQDVTEQKLAEQKVIQNEALLNEAQEIAHLGSWEWNTITNVVSWSNEMYRLFGYAPNEVPINYEVYMNHIHVDDREMVSGYIHNCYLNNTPYTFEHRIVCKDKSIKWLQSKGLVTEKKDGKALKLSGTAMDITELKITEEDLKLKTIALKASNKELEAFCYTISHDLRSPLRAIDGFGRKLANQYGHTLEEEGQRLLNVVRTNAQQMGVLIDSLLEFSRLNRKEIKKSNISMKEVVAKVVEECREQNPDHKATIKINTMHDAPCDRALLHQVWHNLISNAIKFSSKVEKPVVEIGSEKNKGQIVYYVKDNGAGFEMEYKDKLFGVFQRLHSLDDFAGTGVGLASVQRIIHRHGGTVWAEGEVNQGAKFYFTLTALPEIAKEKVSLQDIQINS